MRPQGTCFKASSWLRFVDPYQAVPECNLGRLDPSQTCLASGFNLRFSEQNKSPFHLNPACCSLWLLPSLSKRPHCVVIASFSFCNSGLLLDTLIGGIWIWIKTALDDTALPLPR